MAETPPDGSPDAPNGATEAQGSVPALKQEILERLEPYVFPERAGAAVDAVNALIVQQSHSGPLPLAREFDGYESVLPGAADRILAMAEREQAHRQGLENTVVAKESGMRDRGQAFALVALLAMLAIVALLAYWHYPTQATTLGGTIILGVIALFLGQRFLPKSKDNDGDTEG